jgi:hypothetical protein
MTKQKIAEKVNAIMAAKAGIDASDIKPEDFYDELGADVNALRDKCKALAAKVTVK